MWAIRVLTGPQAGQIYNLKPGRNLVGRNSSVDFQVNVAGISKEHLELQVSTEKVLIKDLQSSNGTFLNGVRIQTAILRLGDKLSLDKILFDVIPGNEIHSQAPMPVDHSQYLGEIPSKPELPQYKNKFDQYLHQVVLPGLYQLLEVFEFRVVIMGFAFVFILMVTLLSLIPMNQITSESIKTESRRRAQTVARALANANEKAIRSGEMTSYSADLVLRDEGISNVYILAKDGSIMAPAEIAGMAPKGDIAGFAMQTKGQIKEMSSEIGGGKIAASCPILIFDPELQQNVAKAQAVVVYDTGSMKFDDGRALSLFVQMLAIALILGGVLFFLMYKLIEYPFIKLNQELDSALREGRDHADIELRLPVLHKVLITVNSLLTRVQQGGGQVPVQGSQLRDQEWMNLIQLVGYPAMLLSKEMVVISINQGFELLTGANGSSLQGQPLQFLPDQAMQKNIEELMRQSNDNTNQVQSDKLDIRGSQFSLQCQAVTVAGDAKLFMITIMPLEDAQGGISGGAA